MLYLRALQDREEEFAAAGATIVAVSAERAPELRASALLNGLRFDLLSDDGGRVARLFGLLVRVPDDLNASFARLGVDIARYTTIADQLLPLPATYVLDRDGVARYAHVDPDPARRPEPDALLAEIRRLTQAEVGP
jgi:peroxiredoxin